MNIKKIPGGDFHQDSFGSAANVKLAQEIELRVRKEFEEQINAKDMELVGIRKRLQALETTLKERNEKKGKKKIGNNINSSDATQKKSKQLALFQ